MSLKTKDGQLVIISGSSRCGKTTNTVGLVKVHEVAFVWDVEAQWCNIKGFSKVSSLAELKKIAIAGKKGRWCFVSNGNLKAEFELFCKCAFHYGKFFGTCAVVAEELADVTNTSKASQAWGILCRRGLKRGISIYAISQRWAEADKTAFGNATDYYLFRMSSVGDIDYMAKKTRVESNRMMLLKPLEFIHYDALTGETKQKKVVF